MFSHKFTGLEPQLSTLQTELEATFKQLANAMEQLILCSVEINEAANNVSHALSTDDDEHKLIDKACYEYEGVLEDLKDKINRADAELDDHMKICSDLRSDLVQLAENARKPIL